MTDTPHPDVPHAPRIWNHWLGGKDNFPVDRAVGDRMAAMYPDIVRIVRIARADRASVSVPYGTWSPRRESASSWTSAPACPPPRTPTRSGVVSCTRWRPDAAEQAVDEYCGVARKP